MNHEEESATRLLSRWRGGDRDAAGRLMIVLQGELRAMAQRYFRAEHRDHTLQPTALVNELYLRLSARENVAWQDRAHFLAVAATTLRGILIDYARARDAVRRGGGLARVTLTLDHPARQTPIEDLLAVDEALRALEELEPRAAKVVEMRFFAGLEEREVAEVLGVSEITVKRDWRFARAWLLARLRGPGDVAPA